MHDLIGLMNEDGELRSVLPEDSVWVPAQVWYSEGEYGGQIEWESYGPAEETPRREDDLGGLLDSFINLVDADSHEFPEFAKRWGVLALCEQHQAPATHDLECWPWLNSEPIVVWRAIAAKLRALLLIASSLHAGELPRRTLWQDYYGEDYEPDTSPFIG